LVIFSLFYLVSTGLVVLALSPQQLLALSAHAERIYPEECCGLMLGKMGLAKTLLELVLLDNHWTAEQTVENVPALGNLTSSKVSPVAESETAYTQRRRYSIDPKDMLRVQKQARSQGLNIIGIYHSHPDQVAVPSECDRRLAWPDYAYVIVSVCNGKAVDIKSWTLDSEHQFQPESIKVSPSSARDRMPVSA
jgi:proteasome lid subunit RPN8/RPN11